jgi:hypothetical protein
MVAFEGPLPVALSQSGAANLSATVSAILKKRLNLTASLYQILQVLSLTSIPTN